MKVIDVDIDKVVPYENNPRNNLDAIDKVAESLKAFGWQQPIVVDRDYIVIVGHTRLLAAKQLGYEKVPVVVADKLKDEQVKAYRLADNKVSEFSVWDSTALDEELDAILNIDMSDFGFNLSLDEVLPEIEDETPPEVNFTEELLEENNYIVLKFDNSVDWLQAQTVFGLETVKALHSKPNFEAKGTGRVIDGAKAINNLIGG